METEVASAATLVAAMMEHYGYVTQARFLVVFKDFFRDAGALVYLMAGVGGVFSMALLGSFRAARYLILGPAFYWFLVGPTHDSNGVIWQLGGGSPHGKWQEGGMSSSLKYRNDIMKKLNQKGAGVTANIKIAQGFYLFAQPINEFTKEFVDVLLKDEDRGDMMVLTKVNGLEIIAQTMPRDTNFVQRMEEGLYKYCLRMMDAANAGAYSYVKNKAPGSAGIQEKQFALQRERVESLGKDNGNGYIPIDHTGFKEIFDAYSSYKAGGNQPSGFFSPTAASLADSKAPIITCEQGWQILAEEIWTNAERALPDILKRVTRLAIAGDSMEYACKELTKKANNEGDGGCNLTPAVSLAIFNRHMARLDTFGRVMERHWNSATHSNPRRQASFVPSPSGALFNVPRSGPLALVAPILDFGNRLYNTVMVESVRRMPAGSQWKATRVWATMASLSALSERDEAMWVSARQTDLANARQDVYSFALNYPYWQGMLLYILAIAYPFLALIVLLPGKAINFLNLPLAWLWVKSWDIGFAVVILLDKTMFNLLPSLNLPQDIQTLGGWKQLKNLPIIIGEGYSYNPLESLHLYYTMISMALLAVPPMTGLLTLRAKRGILSTFYSEDRIGLRAFSSASGQAAANSYVQKQAAARMGMARELSGFATKMAAMGPGQTGGFLEGMKGTVARSYATMAAGAKLGNKGSLTDIFGGNLASAPAAVREAAKTYYDTLTKVAQAETGLERRMNEMFHPLVGRFSVPMQKFYAYNSSMDQSGGFEMVNHNDAHFADAMFHAQKTKLGVVFGIVDDLEEAVVKKTIASVHATGKGFLGSSTPIGASEFLTAGTFGLLAAEQAGADAKDKDGGWAAAWLQHTAGGDAFSRQEYLSRMLSFDPLLFTDNDWAYQPGEHLRLRRGYLTDRQVAEGRVEPEYLPQLFQPFSKEPMPGGADFIGRFMSTTGNDRDVSYLSDEEMKRRNDMLGTALLPFQADEALHASAQKQYDEAVEKRRQFIIMMFGEERVAKFLRERGTGGDNEITVEELAAFVQEEERKRSGGQFFSEQELAGAGTHKYYITQRIDDWVSQHSFRGKGRSSSGNAVASPEEYLFEPPKRQ